MELQEIGKNGVLRVEGRVDASSAPVLQRKLDQLLEEHRLHLVLDLSRVEYLSSAGMRVLLAESKKFQSRKGSFILCSLSDEVADVIHLAGFDRIFPIFATEAEALKSIQAP